MSEEKLYYKIILLGDTSVGKTSIFKKITKDKFDQDVISSIGIDKKTLNFTINTQEGEKQVEIILYDTAGQERFRSISISYFRESKGLFIIYDTTNYESYKNVENWIKSIKDSLGNNNNYLIVLLGNKLDLIEENPQAREVEENEAKELCSNNKLLWGGEVSAKNFTAEQLKEKFRYFIEEIRKKVGDIIKKDDENIMINLNNTKKKGCC